jgi:hypothetical protein
LAKRIPLDRMKHEKAAIRAALQGDEAAVRSELAGLGFLALDDPAVDSRELLAYLQSLHEWHAEDGPFTITPAYVSELITSAAPGTSNWQLEKRLSLPPDAVFSRRLETLTIGVLGQLEATANWHRIMGELIYGREPATKLGEEEAAFFRSRGIGRPAA